MTRYNSNKMSIYESFIGHNQYAHKHQLKVMDETFFAWIERHKRVVENHAFHLGE